MSQPADKDLLGLVVALGAVSQQALTEELAGLENALVAFSSTGQRLIGQLRDGDATRAARTHEALVEHLLEVSRRLGLAQYHAGASEAGDKAQVELERMQKEAAQPEPAAAPNPEPEPEPEVVVGEEVTDDPA